MPINMNGSHLSSNRTFEFQKMNQFELIIGDLAQEVTLSVSKAFLPEVKIIVDAACCAGVTPQTHKNALEAMKICQVIIENE